MIRLVMDRQHGIIVLLALLLSSVHLSSSQSSTLSLLNTDITWSSAGTGTTQINFTLTSALGNNVSPSNAWLGLGFNTVSKMDGAGVVACIYTSGTATVNTYQNTGYDSNLLSAANPTLGISNAAISIADGNFTCSFTRDLSSTSPGYFDLAATPQPYLLVAYGTPVNGEIDYHAGRDVTTSTVNLFADNNSTTTTAPDNSTTTTYSSTTTASPVVIPTTQGNSFQSGIFNVQWTASATDILFTLTTQASATTNIWTAIGFSTDSQMGGDDVVACVYSTSSKGVSRYYNQGNQPIKQSTNNGITNPTISLDGGSLKCSFRRASNFSNDGNFFNLANSYYLLAAYGPTDDSGTLKIHSAKVASSSSINFISCTTTGGGNNINPKYKAHGALMVIAWLFCASTGILIARYYKHIFPSKKPCNLAMWFFIHRPLMICVPVLSIIAFIVILVALGWKWVPTSSQASFAHSIFGILAIVFSIIQVFFAFFRCDKDHPKRFIFNHFHRFVGISTFLLATIAIFIGVTLDKMNLGNSGLAIMIIWVIWVIGLPLLLEIIQRVWRKKHRTMVTDMDQNKDVSVPPVDEKKLNRIKSVFLVLHLLVAFSLTLALVIVIATTKNVSTSIVCKS